MGSRVQQGGHPAPDPAQAALPSSPAYAPGLIWWGGDRLPDTPPGPRITPGSHPSATRRRPRPLQMLPRTLGRTRPPRAPPLVCTLLGSSAGRGNPPSFFKAALPTHLPLLQEAFLSLSSGAGPPPACPVHSTEGTVCAPKPGATCGQQLARGCFPLCLLSEGLGVAELRGLGHSLDCYMGLDPQVSPFPAGGNPQVSLQRPGVWGPAQPPRQRARAQLVGLRCAWPQAPAGLVVRKGHGTGSPRPEVQPRV